MIGKKYPQLPQCSVFLAALLLLLAPSAIASEGFLYPHYPHIIGAGSALLLLFSLFFCAFLRDPRPAPVCAPGRTIPYFLAISACNAAASMEEDGGAVEGTDENLLVIVVLQNCSLIENGRGVQYTLLDVMIPDHKQATV